MILADLHAMAYNRVKVIGSDVGLRPPAGKKL